MKRTGVLIIVFVALLAIYFLTKPRDVEANRPFIQVDSAKVTALTIDSKDGSVTLQKEGDIWNVVNPTNYLANKRYADDAVSKLKQMSMLTKIADGADQFSKYEVDDSSGVKVTVTQAGKNSTFYLGKSGSTLQTTFARKQGSNEVWEIGGSYAGTYKKKPSEWRDKTITDYSMADIHKVSLKYPKETITLTLVDSTWKVDDGKQQFDGEKSLVERVTRMLSKMSTVDFADTLAQNAFDNPEVEVDVELAASPELQVLKCILKDAEGSQYYVRKTGAKTDFVLYKATVNAFSKHADDFKAKPPESPAAAGKPMKKAKV